MSVESKDINVNMNVQEQVVSKNNYSDITAKKMGGDVNGFAISSKK